MTEAIVHPLRLIRNLLHLQENALPPGMRLEHELHVEYTEEAMGRNEMAALEVKAATAALKDVAAQVGMAVEDEFSRAAIFSRLEAVEAWHDAIVEKIALGLLALMVMTAACMGGSDDAWRVQRAGRFGPRVGRREAS